MAVRNFVKDFLKSKHIGVPDDWISACIEFVLSDNPGLSVSNTRVVSEKVYEQWLYCDLTELGTCCLPVALTHQRVTTISGAFPVQVNQVRDVGQPAYAQLQKVQKVDNENASVSSEQPHQPLWEPKPSRMLMMQLTDGTSIVRAMEYRPILALTISLTPGTKLLLSGSIVSRRGILLLEPEHVQVLGGGVEPMVTPNALENVLLRCLGLEETETPREYKEAPQPQVTSRQASQYNPSQRSTQLHPQPPQRNTDTQWQPTPSTSAGGQRGRGTGVAPGQARGSDRVVTSAVSYQSQDNLDDDFYSEDLEAVLNQIEKEVSPPPPTQTTTSSLAGSSHGVGGGGGRGVRNNMGRGGVGGVCGGRGVSGNVGRGGVGSGRTNYGVGDSDNGGRGGAGGLVTDISVRTLTDGGINSDRHVGGNVRGCGGRSVCVNVGKDNDDSVSFGRGGGSKACGSGDNVTKDNFSEMDNDDDYLFTGDDADFLNCDFNELSSNSLTSPLGQRRGRDDGGEDESSLSKKLSKQSDPKNMVLNSAIRSIGTPVSSFNYSHDFNSVAPAPLKKASQLNAPKTPAFIKPLVPGIFNVSRPKPSIPQAVVKPEQAVVNPKTHQSSLMNFIQRLPSKASQDSKSSVLRNTTQGSNVSIRVAETVTTPLTSKNPGHTSTAPGGSDIRGDAGQVQKKSVTEKTKNDPPFTYLCFVPRTVSSELDVVVKGFFMTLLSRLDQKTGEWRLRVLINDGTGSRDVDVNSQVLNELIGMSVEELNQRKTAGEDRVELRAQLTKGLQECQHKLIHLSCLFHLHLSPSLPRPALTALTSLTATHALQLAIREASIS